MNSLVYPDIHQSTMSTYIQKFGLLPEGLLKMVCNRQQNKSMELIMQEALEKNQPANWEDYAMQLLKY